MGSRGVEWPFIKIQSRLLLSLVPPHPTRTSIHPNIQARREIKYSFGSCEVKKTNENSRTLFSIFSCKVYDGCNSYNQGWAPRPAPRKKGCPAPQKSKSCPAPPRENWQNLRGGAGQSLFESLEN